MSGLSERVYYSSPTVKVVKDPIKGPIAVLKESTSYEDVEKIADMCGMDIFFGPVPSKLGRIYFLRGRNGKENL
jgi:hypothetical protein